jgi:enterochelin esterase-like enzyme
MPIEKNSAVLQETIELESGHLGRTVKIDLYWPTSIPRQDEISLLLINDGQDLRTMGLADMLDGLYARGVLDPVLCVGIHAGERRKMEYGTAGFPDYLGRGAEAGSYTDFIFKELLPYIREQYEIAGFREKAFAGFSLGALSAMDIVWNHAEEFSKAGLFSGSFWWRIKDKEDPSYSDDDDRIIHRQIREGNFYPWLRFFFECGTDDESEDRNQNGVIDSIDDTLDLIRELALKGYELGRDILYLEIEEGRHDVATWARAMPAFLEWGWGRQ